MKYLCLDAVIEIPVFCFMTVKNLNVRFHLVCQHFVFPQYKYLYYTDTGI